MAYNTTVDGINFSFNFDTEIISIGAATSRLEADSLQKASREAESSEMGIVFPKIINTSGKITLDMETKDINIESGAKKKLKSKLINGYN